MGCASTYSETIEIYSNPISDFYYNPSDPSTTESLVQFINLSTLNTQSFGISETIIFQMINPIHTYENAGFYDVLLKVVDNNACQDSIQKSFLLRVNYCFMFQMLLHQIMMEIMICLVQRVLNGGKTTILSV